MKKLSEFVGQEHVTAPLRAMVVKNQPATHISFLGDDELAEQLARSFGWSLNCENAQKGDACGVCSSCVNETPRRWFIVSPNTGWANTYTCIRVSTEDIPGYLKFDLRTSAGYTFDPEVLDFFLHVLFEKDGYAQADKLATSITYEVFLEQLISIIKNVLYIKQNVEVDPNLPKTELLRQLAIKMTDVQVRDALKLLWASHEHPQVSDPVAVSVLSALLTDSLWPTAVVLVTSVNEKPITKIEQPLPFNRLLEIAHE